MLTSNITLLSESGQNRPSSDHSTYACTKRISPVINVIFLNFGCITVTLRTS